MDEKDAVFVGVMAIITWVAILVWLIVSHI